MIAVSNTSPLTKLAAMGQFALFLQMYGRLPCCSYCPGVSKTDLPVQESLGWQVGSLYLSCSPTDDTIFLWSGLDLQTVVLAQHLTGTSLSTKVSAHSGNHICVAGGGPEKMNGSGEPSEYARSKESMI